jgi:hypothetical protein
VVQDRAEVTVLLPRRTFPRISQRLLHDRTADRIAEALGRIQHVAATIVPFDTTLTDETEQRLVRAEVRLGATDDRDRPLAVQAHTYGVELPTPGEDGAQPIGGVRVRQEVTIEGRVRMVQVGTMAGKSLEAHIFDDSGGLRLIFMGRTTIAGIVPGARIRATGRVGEFDGRLGLANPRYELVVDALTH